MLVLGVIQKELTTQMQSTDKKKWGAGQSSPQSGPCTASASSGVSGGGAQEADSILNDGISYTQ